MARVRRFREGRFAPAARAAAFFSELTKPASLLIRLPGTPQNHRSPPA